jgi:hypothetical protein
MTIRARTYESKISYDVIFIRIRLGVERVASLVNPLVGNLTVDTNRRWVGKINGSEGTFVVVQTNSSVLPLRFFEGNFFTIFVLGQVSRQQKTKIDVRYKLGWRATFTFLLVYLFPLILSVNFVSQADWDSLKSLFPWFLVFDLIPTLLLIVQLNRIENEISDLLVVEQ